MFKWFNKSEAEKKVDKIKTVNNYETDNDGNIIIRYKYYYEKKIFFNGYHINNKTVPVSSIISHTKNSIVFKDYRVFYNFDSWGMGILAIENKTNLIKYKETQIQTCEYSSENKYWRPIKTDVIATEVIYETTPLEVFIKNFESKYKLIETEDEFNEYLSSTLDCDTWCRMKLYNKMKDLELGDGFINQFADLVGNDLNRYHAMIDLANEVSDKDTLMYLYTYKFSK